MNTQGYFDGAELALAGYATLNTSALSTQITALRNAGLSGPQADDFASRYDVVTQYNDTSTSFSATVFKDASGNLMLAIRGTLESGDFIPTDANIALNGAGYDQIVAMYNWWMRVASPAGQAIQQYQLVGYAPTDNPPSNALFLYSGAGVLYYLVPAPAVSATGNLANALELDADHRVDVTGHSLGAHLALAFNALFPSVANQVTAFDTPGFSNTTTNQQFFAVFGGSVPTAANSGNVTNVIADESNIGNQPWSAIAGLYSPPGTTVNISIENQWLSDEPNPFAPPWNHSQAILTDSLAVFNLLSQLAPTLSAADYKIILNQAANGTSASYERVVDALETLFGIDRTLLPTGNNNRDALYTAIYRLQSDAAFGTFAGQVRITSFGGLSAAQLAEIATIPSEDNADQAFRYALKELNPYAIVGNSAIYNQHNINGELNLYDPVNRTGTLTTEWIVDRAAFLAWKNIANTNDVTALSSNQITEMWRFIDLPQKINLSVIPQGAGAPIEALTHRAAFGGDSADYVQGGKVSDRLYGGGSTDYLEGKGDNDYLEGGSGLDIYQYNGYAGITGSNDGSDTIRDTDGKGVLRYVFYDNPAPQTSVIADASVKISDTEWRSADGRFIYTKSGADLVIIINDGAGGSMTLKDWRDGDFGIRLWEARPTPPTTRDIVGDLEPMDMDPTQSGVQLGFDDLGNVIVGSNAAPDRADTLRDSSGADHIMAHGGDDFIPAFNGGSDWIEAGSGRDWVVAWAASAADLTRIEGGPGDDILTGGASVDYLYANAQIDLAQAITAGGTAGNGLHGDWLSGGWDDDVLVGDLSNDGFSAGRGKDIVVAGAGDDNILGDADWVATTLDWYYVDDLQANVRNFYWFNGTDNYDVGEADIIYGGAGNDYVWSQGGDDLVYGEQGRDTMAGGGGSDVLIGGADDDLLEGDDPRLTPAQHGNDYLDGGAGNDVLLGDGGDDVLIGGTGIDILVGGAGRDIYVFNKGDGTETVFDTPASANDPEASIVVIGDGISRSDIKFRTGSLLVDFGGGDGIHVEGFDQLNPENTPLIGEIRFADGTSMSYADILAQGFDIDGTEGNDSGEIDEPPMLVGTGVTDRIRGFGGDDVLFGLAGNDILDGGAGSDQMVGGAGLDQMDGGDDDDFLWGDEDGLAVADQGADVMSGGAGNDYLQAYGGDDVMFGDRGSDTLYGQAGADYMEGGDGDDFLWGDDTIADQGNDTLDGGAGNDQLVGYTGNDTYVFGRGDGEDTVFDQDATVGNVDVVQFAADITPDDISAERSGVTLTFTINGTTDRLTIANQFNSTADRVEEIRFADGTVWTPATIPMLIRGTTANNNLVGTAGPDVFEGLEGNDTLSGGGGNDTYRIFRGDGQDTITDSDGTAGNLDKIVYASDIPPAEVNATRSGSDLVLKLTGTTDQVTVTNYFQNDGATSFLTEQIKFLVDGTVWDLNTVKTAVLTGTTGDDTLTGFATDDILSGLAGNDTLVGNDGNDTLVGGIGADELEGRTGNDTYLIARGDGSDIIADNGTSVGDLDSLVFIGSINPDEVVLQQWNDQLRINVGDGSSNHIEVRSHFGSDGTDIFGTIEQIVFQSDGTVWDTETIRRRVLTGTDASESLRGYPTDDTIDGKGGDDSLYGEAGNDLLMGGSGNDYFQGGTGNDTLIGGSGNEDQYGGGGSDIYVYAVGDGMDNIREYPSTETVPTDVDILRFAPGVNPGDITLTRSVYDLLVTHPSSGGRVTVYNHFYPATSQGDYAIERIEFADGTVWSAAAIDQMFLTATSSPETLYGSEGADAINGLGGDDSIYGMGGNDTLAGNAGNDFLAGGCGADTYLFSQGDGRDTISGGAVFGNDDVRDTLQFGAGITPGNVALSQAGANLVLTVNGTPDEVTIVSYFLNWPNETITFADGTVWTDEMISRLFPVNGTSGNDTIRMYGRPDYINGLGGNDVLLGGDANDTLDGGLGSDTLYGENGNDTLIASAGESKNAAVSNFLYGGAGDDVLISSGKTDFLYGESGNDILLGSAGRDGMEDTGGNNLFFGAANVDNIGLGDQNDIVMAGAGNDSLDGDRDATNVRGQDIVLFNKADGTDTVTRLGTGSTISIGGGTLYSNLSLEVQGATLRLKTASGHYISLSDWYGSPANKAVTTLQIVIEGTRDYKPTSSNPMLRQKVQVFDFLRLVAAFDAARAAGQTFNVANNLANYRIGGGDTEMIGGAIAYQYARTGNLGTLTYSQMRAVINDPAFGVSAQPIAAPVVAAALDAGTAVDASAAAFAAATLAAGTTTATSDASRMAADSGTIADQMVQVDSIALETDTLSVEEDATPPIPDFVTLPDAAIEHLPILPDRAAPRIPLELLTPPTPILTSLPSSPPGAQTAGTWAAHAFGSTPQSAGAPESRPASHNTLVDDTPTGSGVSGTQGDAVHAAYASTSRADDAPPGETDSLIEQWFAPHSLNDDLTLLDEIARGESAGNTPDIDASIAAAWQHLHAWLNGSPNTGQGEDSDASGGGYLGATSFLGDAGTFVDMPQPVVGLRNVAGHDLKPFSGLREGLSVLAQ